MNFHIHYLSAFLVLLAISFPTSLIGIFYKLNFGRINTILPNSLSYLLFVIIVFFTGYIGSINYNISIYFVILSFIMSLICIGIEIFEAMLIHFFKYRFTAFLMYSFACLIFTPVVPPALHFLKSPSYSREAREPDARPHPKRQISHHSPASAPDISHSHP